jgi:hypothetical protein
VRWRACESFVAKNGISYPLKAAAGAKAPTAYIGRLPGPDGKPGTGEYVVDWVEYPQVRECHRLHKALKDAEDRFGLSPAARTRIRANFETAPEAGTKNDEAEALAAKYGLN